MKISGYIMAFNEAWCIEGAIRCLREYVDDLLVLDMGSNDGTIECVKELSKELCFRYVLTTQKDGRYSEGWEQPKWRNWCVDNAENDFILTLDADECLSEVPADLFRNALDCISLATYHMVTPCHYVDSIPMQEQMFTWFPDPHVRFFDRRIYRYHNVPLHCGMVNAKGESANKFYQPIEICRVWHWKHLYLPMDNPRGLSQRELHLKPTLQPLPRWHRYLKPQLIKKP